MRLFLLFLPALLGAQVFPGAVATDTDLLIAANRGESTLSGGINASTLTIPVASTATFLAPSVVTIENERIKICSIGGGSLTACSGGRGYDSSTAASHVSGRAVSARVSAAYHNLMREEMKAVQAALGVGLGNVQTMIDNSITDPLPASTGPLEYLRTKPNVAGTVYEFSAHPVKYTTDYAWTSTQTQTITTPGTYTFTVTPCPLGIPPQVRVSGGTGTAEVGAVNGASTCTAGASTGTIVVALANAHSGSYTVGTSTAGISEALAAAGESGSVTVPKGTHLVYGTITPPNNYQTITGFGDGSEVKVADSANINHTIDASSLSGFVLQNVRMNGNFRNQASGFDNGIYLAGCKGCTIRNNLFEYWGAGGGDGVNPYGNAILSYDSPQLSILNNRFQSNYWADVGVSYSAAGNAYKADGFRYEGNIHGVPSLEESNTNTNWWDNRSGGVYNLNLTGSRGCIVSNNRMYGGRRKDLNPSYKGNGFIFDRVSGCVVSGNDLSGLGNGLGTVAVTNGGTTLTGTNTYFSTAVATSLATDATAYIELEGDVTQYRIVGACASATSCEVTPAIVRTTGSGLRYRINTSADLLGCGDYTTVTGNVVRYSRDIGIGCGRYTTNMVGAVVSNNVIMFNGTCGLGIFGNAANMTVSGNTIGYNFQGYEAWTGTYTVGQIQFEISAGPFYFNHISISDNQILGDPATLSYGIVVGLTSDVRFSRLSNNIFLNVNSGISNQPLTDYFAYLDNTPVGWSTITLANGWTATPAASARIEEGGLTVRMKGAITAGTLADGTTIGTLPSAHCPAVARRVPVTTLGGGGAPSGVAHLQIGADCAIKIYGAGVQPLLSLDGAFAVN